MKYLYLTFNNELLYIETSLRPEYFFAGKCKAWWGITMSRGQNLVSLIQAVIFSRSHKTIAKYLEQWEVQETDCIALSMMLGLYLEKIGGQWHVIKNNQKQVNGSKGVVVVEDHPFNAICSYYLYLHIHNINYSLILKKP